MTTPMPSPVPDRTVRLLLFLRVCLLHGGYVAVLLGGFQALTTGDDRLRAFGDGAIWGLVIGAVVALMLAQQQWSAAVGVRDRRLADDPAASPVPETGVTIRRTIRVPVPHADVVRLLPDAAAALDRSAVLYPNDTGEGGVRLSTPWSWNSWGEHITLTAGPDDDGSTPVTITSRPQLRLTVIDSGRNAANVEHLVGWLRTATAPGADPGSGVTAVSEKDLPPAPDLV